MDSNVKINSKNEAVTPSMFGESAAIKKVILLIDKVAASNSSVFIQGESGTGKGLVARAIHFKSSLASKPFIKINAINLSENESCKNLMKRMYVGDGANNAINGGTLYLDEIADYPDDLQKSILQFIDENENRKDNAGGYRHRIIASTNKDIEECVKNKKLRKELYYRISTFPLYIPPLRDHKEDIIILANYFVERYVRENKKHITQFSEPAIEMLISYHWPGNVRELENIIERAVLICEGDIIRAEDMPPSLQKVEKTQQTNRLLLVERVANLEKELIFEALKKTGGCQRRAAAELGITERILGYKINKYKIRGNKPII